MKCQKSEKRIQTSTSIISARPEIMKEPPVRQAPLKNSVIEEVKIKDKTN